MQVSAEHFRPHMGQGDPPVHAMREKALTLKLGQAGGRFHRIPGLAEAPGFLQVDQPERCAGLAQTFAGPYGLGKLIGAVGNQQQGLLASRGILVHHQGAMSGQCFSFAAIEHARALPFRDDEATDAASLPVNRWQNRQGAVVVSRENHPGDITHFSQ